MTAQLTWTEQQAAFAAALMDGRKPAPAEFFCKPGSSGFSVYRNNSIVALIEALRDRFTVTYRLVGDEFFRAMARAYAIENRPRSAMLFDYGADLPTFIERFAPARQLPYLADVARLELAWSEAYHAQDRCSLTPQSLTGYSPDALLPMRIELHPSLRLLRSIHPVAAIWAAHQEAEPPVLAEWCAQDVLIVRPEADVHVHVLGPGMLALTSALLASRPIQEALESALDEAPASNSGSSLVDLFHMGAVVALHSGSQEIPR